MRGILVIAIVVVVAALLGWLTISSDATSTSVTVDTQKVVQDTEEFVETAQDQVAKVTDDAKTLATDDNDEAAVDSNSPTETGSDQFRSE